MDDESHTTALKELQRTVDSLTTAVLRRAPKTVPRISRRRHAFERGLRRHWGRGLGLYHLTLDQARELGSEINRVVEPAERDQVFQVLTRLHARACRIADEVYCLLGSGHGDGAMNGAAALRSGD
ncbi:hypothetical protein ACI1MP_31415 [Kitasatospora griseola]|uniref:hypothetical protein n=1 Tax=Kitasatospora griseola TaxID=2064 RepID=UPI0038559058